MTDTNLPVNIVMFRVSVIAMFLALSCCFNNTVYYTLYIRATTNKYFQHPNYVNLSKDGQTVIYI